MCVLFAATYPERTRALVLYGTYAKRRDPDDDYPWAPTAERGAATRRSSRQTWGENVDIIDDVAECRPATSRLVPAPRDGPSLSPAAARDLILMNSKADVRELLPTVQCPTLVLHRSGRSRLADRRGPLHRGADSGCAFRRAAGDDHVPAVRPDEILDEVEEFLTGVRPVPAPESRAGDRPLHRSRGLDGEGAQLGDAAWAHCSTRTMTAVRRELARFSGEEIDTAGDGFLAAFDGPARAIRCGLAVRDALRRLGLTCERACTRARSSASADKPRGIAVHVGARVMSLAARRRGPRQLRRPATSSRAPASSSRTAASTS